MRRLSVLLLLLVPLAAGCGSEASSLQGSGDALKDASSSRVEWKLEGKGMPEWALMTSTGSIDYANGRGEMVYQGEERFGSGGTRSSSSAATRICGAKVGGKTYWVKEAIYDAPGAHRFEPGPSGTSPDRLLKDLIKASRRVEKLGSEEIRGVTTTHYRAHLDRTKAATRHPQRRAAARAVDAWIDEQGLPRRIRVPYGSGDDAAGVVDLFDFGVPVDVAAPPASEILSEDKMDKLMEKECAAGTRPRKT